jgi:hypothetical protein
MGGDSDISEHARTNLRWTQRGRSDSKRLNQNISLPVIHFQSRTFVKGVRCVGVVLIESSGHGIAYAS